MGEVQTGREMAVDPVIAEVQALRRQLEVLERRVAALEGDAAPAPDWPTLPESPAGAARGGEEGFGAWLDRGAILQKLAAVSFILVFALLLRTITDYGYVNVKAGMVLGLVYVSLLAGTGYRFYSRGNALAPVFAGCGFLLLFAIVVEGLNRFATLAPATALLILAAALAAGSFLGLRFAAARLLLLSLCGVVVSSLLAGFPRVVFPAVGLLLLAAGVVATIADRRGLAPGLKWWMALLALAFWALWAFKLQMTWRHGQALAPYYPGWYLPLLALFGLFYLTVSAEKVLRNREFGAYDIFLPTFAMFLLFLAGRVMVSGIHGAGSLFGALAVTLAGVQIGAGWRLSLRAEGGCAAVGGLIVAGAFMLALGLPELLDSLAWALPGWSLVAFGLALLSGRCESAVVRVISYLYQFAALWVAVVAGALTRSPEGNLSASLAAALALAVFGLAHYLWSRKHPPAGGTLFARLDPHDYSAVLVLLTGLAGGYFLGALVLDVLAERALAEPINLMRCGRSLLINGGALVLLLFGVRRRLPELLWVAAALAVLGCLKVFFVDLFRSNGLPLVLSVLSFGVVAAAGSVVMGRWRKTTTEAGRE